MRTHRFILAAVGLLVVTLVLLCIALFKERAGNVSVIQVKSVFPKPPVDGAHFGPVDRTNDNTSKVHRATTNDCGPLFEGEVNRSVTGRICQFETYTETLKDVVQRTVAFKHSEASVYDWSSSGLTDVHITVRTTSNFHLPRLSLLMATWMQKVPPSQVVQ